MANSKENNKKETKKTTSSKTTTNTKKKSTTTKKSNVAKKAPEAKTTTKKETTKSSAKSPTKKTNTTKINNTAQIDKNKNEIITSIEPENKKNKVNEVETNIILEQTRKIEKVSYEENSIYSTHVEPSKFIKLKKKKSLLPIGIIIIILGLGALIISLIANRIIDREFISDTGIAVMILISIVIEAIGAFIIVNES